MNVGNPKAVTGPFNPRPHEPAPVAEPEVISPSETPLPVSSGEEHAPEDLQLLSDLKRLLGSSPRIETAFQNLIVALDEEKKAQAGIVHEPEPAVTESA